jgi:AraC family transcriptional regulator
MNQLALPPPKPFRQALPPALATTRGRGWSCPSADIYALGSHAFVGLHHEHVVCVQLSGESRLYQEREGHEQEEDAAPGHVSVTPAGPPKTWRRCGDAFVLVFSIAPAHLAGTLERATGRTSAHANVRLRDEFHAEDPRIAELARSLWRELARDRLGARLYVEATADQILLQLLREHCELEASRSAPVPISPHKLRLAKAFIQENLAEELAVDYIARAVGMSPFHFAHAFRAATGVPPHRYVMLRRMERAKALLRGSELTLTEIAQRVGYSSASHFSVGFRKLAQVTPSDYRKAP